MRNVLLSVISRCQLFSVIRIHYWIKTVVEESHSLSKEQAHHQAILPKPIHLLQTYAYSDVCEALWRMTFIVITIRLLKAHSINFGKWIFTIKFVTMFFFVRMCKSIKMTSGHDHDDEPKAWWHTPRTPLTIDYKCTVCPFTQQWVIERCV